MAKTAAISQKGSEKSPNGIPGIYQDETEIKKELNMGNYQILKAIHQQIFDYVRDASAEEIEDLEKLLHTEIKIASGCKEAQYLLTMGDDKGKLDIKNITMTFNPGLIPAHPKFENPAEKSPNTGKPIKINPDNKKEHEDDTSGDEEDPIPAPSNLLPARFQISKTPLLSDILPLDLMLAEPLKPQKKMRIKVAFILDDAQFLLFGECKSCEKVPESCQKCKLKGGVRVKITGFTFAEKRINLTAWTTQIPPLIKIQKGLFIESIQMQADRMRVEFLRVYRGRLFIASASYREFDKTLSITAQKLQCISFKTLYTTLTTE